MRSSALRFAAPALAFALTAPDSAAGGARIVDAPGLPPFYSLQEAVDAATDGDTILVATGLYEGFTIGDKSLHVVAAAGHDVRIAGAIQVLHLAGHRIVLLSGLKPTGRIQPVTSEPGLIVSSCQGHVRVEGCTIAGGKGAALEHPNFGTGGHAVVLQASPRVVFSHCTITGGNGNGDGGNCYDCNGGDGGFGVRVNQSAPVFYQCAIQGGHGGTSGYQGGSGGHGVWQGNTFVFAAGSLLRGGNGGHGTDFIWAYGGDGGNGLLVNAAGTSELLDNTYIGGTGGTAIVFPQNAGQPGAPFGGAGTVTQHAGEARELTLARMVFDGSQLQVTATGLPGDKVWLRFASRPEHRFQSSIPGLHAVKNAPVPLVAAGVIPASGSLLLTVPITDLVGQAERVIYAQGFGFDGQGAGWLGSPMHALVLDLGSPPDCNGNQQSDLADTLLGISPDCGPNLVPDACDPDCDGNSVADDCDLQAGTHQDCNANDVPDTCDISIGFSADCNANGVPDDCDLASGFSPDANGNGIPDECEPNTTWWVDDNALPGGNGSPGSPFQSVEQGILAAIDGDEIVLRDGVYSGPGNREVSFQGRSVVVRSENGPASCVFDLQDVGRAFFIQSSETVRIEGIKFLNGRGGDGSGGGGAILAMSSHLTAASCVFESCASISNGGALQLSDCGARIEDCVFIESECLSGDPFGSRGGAIVVFGGGGPTQPVRIVRSTFVRNFALEGGAIYATGNHPVLISHSRFLANEATSFGGAIAARGFGSLGGTMRVDDCLFAGNSSQDGGAILVATYFLNSPADFRVAGSTFVQNHATNEGGAIAFQYASTCRVDNCIAWGNTSPFGAQFALDWKGNATYGIPTVRVERCDVQGGQAGVAISNGSLTWAAGNLNVDPQFADPDGPDNNPLTVVDNDYRPIAGSPVNDAGDNALVPADVHDVDGDGNTTEPTPLDLDLTMRFVEDLLAPNVGAGTPPLVDVGCYER